MRASLTEPVLCATVDARRQEPRELVLVVALLQVPEHRLARARADSRSPWCSFSSSVTISRAVVEPRPYFFVRSGSTDVVLPRNTLALIARLLQPQLGHALVDGGDADLVEHEVGGGVVGVDDHQPDGVAQREAWRRR